MNSMPRTGANLSLLLLLLLGARLAAGAQSPPPVVWEAQAANNYIINPAAISPDGAVVATTGNNTIQIWQTGNGAPVITLFGHGMWVSPLVFSGDGAYLASGGGDRNVRVWRTADWSLAYTIPTTNQGPPVSFSPDSQTLAIGNGAAIELRRATNGTMFRNWTATAGELKALAFSPDGRTLASGAGYRGVDTALKLWEAANGTLLRSVATAQTYGIARVVFSPDGRQVLTGSEYLHHPGPMQSWRVDDGALLRTFPMNAYDMAFTPDGAVLAAVGTNIVFFRVSDGAVIAEYADGFPSITPGAKGIVIAPRAGLFVRSRGFGQVLAGRVPTVVARPRIEGGRMILGWEGGPGRFRLQRSSSPAGEWQDEGDVLTTNSVSVPLGGASGFYRVRALAE